MGSLLSTSQPEPAWKAEAQFAMESSCFCVVCGSPFGLFGEVHSFDTEAEHYQWMRIHRLIGSRHDVHHHNMADLSEDGFHSACYNTSDCSDVFLSVRSTYNDGNDFLFHIDGLYPDTNIPHSITINAMQRIQDYDTVFALHEDCLQISRRVIEHLQPVTPGVKHRSSLSILNKILQSRYRRNAKCAKPNSIIAKNDLFNLCIATGMNGAKSVVCLSLLEWWEGLYDKFYTDPMRLKNITAYVHRLLKDTVAPKTLSMSFVQSNGVLSGIERLPTELLIRISTHLSPYSALALHRGSTTLARKVPMDNYYWRTTILNGAALPYLWDVSMRELEIALQRHLAAAADASSMWDWKSVGELLASKRFPPKSSDLRIAGLPGGLWNRRRIWSIVEEAYNDDYGHSSDKDGNNIVQKHQRREPVFDWQLEEIMNDLGHYS